MHLFYVQKETTHTALFYQIHMYGALADPEPPGGLPYCGTVLDDVGGQFAGPFLDVTFQDQHSPYPDMLHVYAAGGDGILFFWNKKGKKRPPERYSAFLPFLLCALAEHG